MVADAAAEGERVMGEVMSVRVEQWATLQNQRAEARRAAHANGQRVVELESELVQVRPAAAAMHTYCAAWLAEQADDIVRDLHEELLAVHCATTPSQTPPTHVIVAVDELEALRAIADAAGALAQQEEADANSLGYEPRAVTQALIDAVDAYPGGA